MIRHCEQSEAIQLERRGREILILISPLIAALAGQSYTICPRRHHAEGVSSARRLLAMTNGGCNA